MYLIVPFMRIFSLAKRINKKITIHKTDKNDNSNNQESFLTESYSFDLPFFWKLTYIPRYVKYFNSFEADTKPLVKSTKYQYSNASNLYRETKLKVWIQNQIKDKLRSIDLKMASNRKMYKINQYQMFQISKNIKYASAVLRL